MAKHTLDEYDRQTLREAKRRIMVVYEYNYGCNSVTKRLETILRKIDSLIKESIEDGK